MKLPKGQQPVSDKVVELGIKPVLSAPIPIVPLQYPQKEDGGFLADVMNFAEINSALISLLNK